MSRTEQKLRRSHLTPDGASRRRVHRGAALAGIAARLRGYAARRPSFPKRFGVVFMGNGINEDHWSAEGAGADMKLSKTLSPLEPLKQKINVIDGLFIKALTGQGIHPGADRQPAFGRAYSEGRHHPFGHQRGSDDRQPRRAGHAAIQHRAGLRAAHDRLSRDQFLDGLQFAHLLADAGFAGAGGSLPVARLGQPVRKSRQPAEYQHSRPRERPRRGSLSRKISSSDKGKLDEYLTSVREVEKRVEGMRKGKDKRGGRGQGEEHARCSHGPAGQRPAGRPARSRAADVRHHRHRIPDRQDARRFADYLARSFGDVLSVPASQGRTPRRIAQQQFGWLRTHRALPREPVCLSGVEARQHAGRRRHGARQLLPDVPFEHVDRPQARQLPACRWCWPAAWAARSRPDARSII